METLSSSTAVAAVTPVQVPVNTTNSPNDAPAEPTKTEAGQESEFSAFLMKSVGRSGQEEVSEEELFSGIIAQQLNAMDPEAAAFYQDKIKSLSVSMAREDGYIPLEDVAKEALRATVDAGKITEEKAGMINAAAFKCAQLDSNLDCLYDNRGETKAVGKMEEAMMRVKDLMDKIDSGELKLESRSLDIPSNQGSTPGEMVALGMTEKSAEAVDGAAGVEGASEGGSEKQVRFTWKHEASDGNLAILLPSRLNGLIDGASIYKDGELIEEGHYSKKTGDNRTVYRFDQPGGEYGNNLDVVLNKKSGGTISYHVNDGGERTYVPQDDFEEGK